MFGRKIDDKNIYVPKPDKTLLVNGKYTTNCFNKDLTWQKGSGRCGSCREKEGWGMGGTKMVSTFRRVLKPVTKPPGTSKNIYSFPFLRMGHFFCRVIPDTIDYANKEDRGGNFKWRKRLKIRTNNQPTSPPQKKKNYPSKSALFIFTTSDFMPRLRATNPPRPGDGTGNARSVFGRSLTALLSTWRGGEGVSTGWGYRYC